MAPIHPKMEIRRYAVAAINELPAMASDNSTYTKNNK